MKKIIIIVGILAAAGGGAFYYTRNNRKYLAKKILKGSGLEATEENLQKAMGDLSASELREEIKTYY